MKIINGHVKNKHILKKLRRDAYRHLLAKSISSLFSYYILWNHSNSCRELYQQSRKTLTAVPVKQIEVAAQTLNVYPTLSLIKWAWLTGSASFVELSALLSNAVKTQLFII